MSPLKSSLIHTLEFFVAAGSGFLIIKLFPLAPDQVSVVVGAVIAFFLKFARTSPVIPVKDYVNGPEEPTK